MSASKKKKQRQDDPTLTQRERKELSEQQAMKRKSVTYTAIAIVSAILVAALLLWDAQIFQRGATAVSVNGRNYNAADVTYYYRSALNTEYQMAQYSLSSFDPNASARGQYTDETMTKTYHDTFMEQALEELTRVAALEDAAQAAGYTLTAEDKAAVQTQLDSIKTNGYTVQSLYGKLMSNGAFRTSLERDVLVNSFYNSQYEAVTVEETDISDYYKEHAAELDSYDFRQFFISGTPEAKTDANGTAVPATEEETAAALSAAKLKADAAVTEIMADGDTEAAFITAAPKYVAESSKASYETNEAQSLATGTVGSSMTQYGTAYAEWLMAEGRRPGDVAAVESSNGYYVVLFLDRYLVDTGTADIRHTLIRAELDQADDAATADVDESTVPTQAAIDAAKVEAQAVLDRYNAGEKTAEAFGALATETSDDPGSNTNGGLYEKVPAGQMFAAFDAWISDPARQPGDTTLVENTQSGQQGWHVIYFQGWNVPVWENTVENTIKNESTTAWQTSLLEGYTATLAAGAKYVK